MQYVLWTREGFTTDTDSKVPTAVENPESSKILSINPVVI